MVLVFSCTVRLSPWWNWPTATVIDRLIGTWIEDPPREIELEPPLPESMLPLTTPPPPLLMLLLLLLLPLTLLMLFPLLLRLPLELIDAVAATAEVERGMDVSAPTGLVGTGAACTADAGDTAGDADDIVAAEVEVVDIVSAASQHTETSSRTKTVRDDINMC